MSLNIKHIKTESNLHLELESCLWKCRERLFEAKLTSTENALLQVFLVINVFCVGIVNLIIFFRERFLQILEIIRNKFPTTTREKLQNAESNVNFLLHTYHESWLEEDQHEKINQKCRQPLAEEKREIMFWNVHRDRSVRIPESS